MCNKNRVLLLLVAALVLVAGTMHAQWIQTNGPTANHVRSLCVSGTNLFAGDTIPYGGGVFLSTNDGDNWTQTISGLTNRYVCVLAVSGSNLFAGTFDGVFLSTNNGTSWTAAGLTGMIVWTFAVSGTNIFAGTEDRYQNGGGVFLSTDNGTSWTPSGLTNMEVRSLVFSGTNLFAGTLIWGLYGGEFGRGVFLSTDNGTSWTEVNTGLTNMYVYAFAVSGTNLFAGTFGGVFLSTNNGTSWTAVNAGLMDTKVYSLAVLGTNIFAGTFGSVFLSTDNGTSWTAAGLTDAWVWALAVSGTNLFAATSHGVWRRPLSEMITLPDGTISGTVRVNGNGLADVTITLLDQNGNSMRDFPPTATNNAGQYTFNAVPSPLPYQVIIVEPLGYGIVDPPGNPQPVTLSAGGTGTVDFMLTVAVISNNAQGLGYWKHQFDVYVTGRGSAQETQEQLNAYMLAVQQFYTPHFTLFQNLTTFADWSGVLSGPNKASMRDKAKQHLATLVLNFASLKIGQYFVVTADGRTAGDVLTYASGLISNANATNAQLETAKDLAEEVNNKQMIAAGLVPLGGGILYKGTLESITWGFGVPSQFALSQNYPNPFNPVTTIRYELSQPAHVTLAVYDITGRQVAELVNETKEAGYYDARFDASNLASGMYLYRIQAGEFVVTKKLILLK